MFAQIAEVTHFSKPSCWRILFEELNKPRVSQNIAPRLLITEQKEERMAISGMPFCAIGWDANSIAGGLNSKNGFQMCFQKLYERYQKCIIAQGDYIEGGCASVLCTIHFEVPYTLSLNF
ncbi:hypothetical protein TNCV_4401471 [Trichonephila clavipes]|nr:hypothetical protein TNCV_4401471 [Trichonephila clavipes]